MAYGTIVNRKANGFATANAYQLQMEAYTTGAVSGSQRQVTMILRGYAVSPGGYQSWSSPSAWTAWNSAQINNWWPRTTWINFVSSTIWVDSGQNHWFEGYFNSTSTTNYMPLAGTWSAGVTLWVDPVPPSSVSVSITSVSRTGFTLSRSWSHADTCEYNIGGQGWQSEGSTLNGIYCNADTVSGLQPNKSYTVQIRMRYRGSAWVNSGTVSNTTSGNAPTLTSLTISDITTTSAKGNFVATYDTNASFSSSEINYGLTTGYGSTTTNGNMTDLIPNTTYFYRGRVRDNWNRWSGYISNSFITHPTTVQISNIEATNIAEESIEYTLTFPTSELVDLIECILYEADGTTIKETKNFTTGIASPKTVLFEDLVPDTTYILKVRLRTIRSGAYSSLVSLETKTIDTKFLYVIDSSGAKVQRKAYILGKANLLKGNKETYLRGVLTPVIDESLANILDTETMSSAVINSRYIGVLAGTQYSFDFTVDAGFTSKVVQFNQSLKCTAYNTYSPGSYTLTTNANTSFIIIGYEEDGGSTLNTTTAKEYFKDAELYKTSKKKAMLKNDIVKISGLMRYIDIGQSGNSVNERSHIVQIRAFDTQGNEVAFGKNVSILKGIPSTDPLHSDPGIIVNGDISEENFLSLSGETASNRDTLVRVDLGAEYEIDYVVLWRYYVDNRVYHKSFLYGRRDNTELCWKFHDWKNEGVYHETPEGYTGNVKYQIWRTAPVINNVTLDTASGVPNTNGTLLTVDATEIATGIPVIDRLNSIRRDAFLSANQGRLLKTYIGSLDSLTTKTKVNIVAAINELLNDFTGLSGYSNIIEAILEAPFTK